jgi:hypothetical protein
VKGRRGGAPGDHSRTMLGRCPSTSRGFDEEDFERLKGAIGGLAEAGPFDANDALSPLLQAGVTDNAGDVATILGDLADLGYLRALGGDPPRWELARPD